MRSLSRGWEKRWEGGSQGIVNRSWVVVRGGIRKDDGNLDTRGGYRRKPRSDGLSAWNTTKLDERSCKAWLSVRKQRQRRRVERDARSVCRSAGRAGKRRRTAGTDRWEMTAELLAVRETRIWEARHGGQPWQYLPCHPCRPTTTRITAVGRSCMSMDNPFKAAVLASTAIVNSTSTDRHMPNPNTTYHDRPPTIHDPLSTPYLFSLTEKEKPPMKGFTTPITDDLIPSRLIIRSSVLAPPEAHISFQHILRLLNTNVDGRRKIMVSPLFHRCMTWRKDGVRLTLVARPRSSP